MNTQPVPDPVPPAPRRGIGWAKVLLLLILVGGLVAAGTWYVMDEQAKKDKAAMQKELDTKKKELASARASAMVTLKIREWGVEMTADPGIADAKYAIKSYTSSSDDPGGGDGTRGGQGAYFTTTTLLRGDAMCDADGSSPLGGVFRTSTSPKAEMNATKVGDYYYYYQNGHQSVCSGTAEAEEGARLLEEAFRTLTAS